jgi:hypothetical protein
MVECYQDRGGKEKCSKSVFEDEKRMQSPLERKDAIGATTILEFLA